MGAHRPALASAPGGGFAPPRSPRPRPREDLEVHEREEAGQQVFVVKDPVLGAYHRLGPLAYAVLEALEESEPGEVAAPALPALLRERHGITISAAEADGVVAQLGRMALFEITPEAAAARGEPVPIQAALAAREDEPEAFAALQARLLRKWRPRPPFLERARRVRVRLFDPQPILKRLEPLGRRLLTPRAAVATGVLALVALGIQLEHATRLRVELLGVLSRPLFFLAVALVVTLLHELGHGLACHLYGGEVRDVGLMLLYFVLPAAYCDVSDAHLIESRRRRAVVALAGCYVNVILWVAATLVWRVFEPELVVTRMALAVIGATSLSLFLNLNPLLPLDGYYALEELLGVQNLRLRGGRGGVYRLYRLASSAYLLVFLPLAMSQIFRLLVGRFRLVGFVAFCLLALPMVAPLFRGAWRWALGR